MPARFILSLDCEGKWGVADVMTSSEHYYLTESRLRRAYEDLVRMLDEFELPVTFAFVGLFAARRSDFRLIRAQLDSLARVSDAYLGAALRDLDTGSRQGWHGEWALESVAAARSKHEIALHGVTHVPWTSMAREFFEEELSLLSDLGPQISASKTFVYPRNQVAHTQLLAAAGFEGFRLGRGHRSRIRSLISEFDLTVLPEKDPVPSSNASPLAIPAGYFLNWPRGARKTIPSAITCLRVERLLRRASAENSLVHLWFHPENLASAPNMLKLLRSVLKLVASAREEGTCEVHTQLSYCRRLRRADVQASRAS